MWVRHYILILCHTATSTMVNPSSLPSAARFWLGSGLFSPMRLKVQLYCYDVVAFFGPSSDAAYKVG